MVIGALGASVRAEERLLVDSNYWQEVMQRDSSLDEILSHCYCCLV